MAKYLLAEGGDINWMAMFALVTFVIIFVIVVIAVFGRRQETIDYLSEIPLHDGTEDQMQTTEDSPSDTE